MRPIIHVYGAGLAGCEAAYRAVKTGAHVVLHEMKPHKYTPAHHSEKFSELVCSNSLRSDSVTNAVGLLKQELREMGSLIMEAADATRVPAGSALAVDRDLFSEYVTQKIKNESEAKSFTTGVMVLSLSTLIVKIMSLILLSVKHNY